MWKEEGKVSKPKKSAPSYGVITEVIEIRERFYFGGDKKDWDEKRCLVQFGSHRTVTTKSGKGANAHCETKSIKVTFE